MKQGRQETTRSRHERPEDVKNLSCAVRLEYTADGLQGPGSQEGQRETCKTMQQRWETQWQEFLRTLQPSQPGAGNPTPSEASPWEDPKAFLASFEQGSMSLQETGAPLQTMEQGLIQPGQRTIFWQVLQEENGSTDCLGRTLADNTQWTFPATSNIHGLRWEFQVDKTSTKGKNEWCDISDDLTTAVEKNPTAQTEGGKALPPKQGRKCCYKSGFVEMQGKPCPCPSLEETIQQKHYLDKPQRIHSAEQEAELLEVRKDFRLGDGLMGCPKNQPSEESRERPKEEKDGKSRKAVKRDQGIQTEGRRYRCAQCGKSFRHRQTVSIRRRHCSNIRVSMKDNDRLSASFFW
ncbi:Zinc finger protein, partial [Ophiophagus hannah]